MAEQRLIDANAFKKYIRNAYEETKNLYTDNGEWAKEITESFCQDIDEQPTIEPERKTGKWRRTPMACYGGGTITEYECSVCEEHQIITSNYCPNCGSYNGGEQP